MRRAQARALALAALLGLSCMRPGGPPRDPRQGAPGVDSVTVAHWRFDEAAGTRCADAGPFRLDATAGPGTRSSYGRYGGAREFTRVIDSFVFAPSNPVLDPTSGFTVEAWVLPRAFGQYEDTPIAARWTQEGNEQSWLFGIVGAKIKPPVARIASPGYHDGLVITGRMGQLVFAFQPADASAPRAFTSSQRLIIDRWTHVAASFDGSVVRIFIDGRLDAQYATRGRIQASRAPLLIGNYFDPRRLTSFSGELRMEPGGDENPYYAFEGLIDELRISAAARTEFPGTGR
ncbi:MAG: LamG domain-containing protein [Candidatus Eiseniibacteriota bacterium]